SASISFDASVMELLGTLSLGGTVILAKNVLELPELPARDRVRTCITVPSAMQTLLAIGPLPAGIRAVVFGGEVLKPSLVDRLRVGGAGPRVINVYGPTEDAVYSTTTEIFADTETITIGRSVPGSRSYILDEAMRPVADGESGELYLAGDQLARGYLHDEERTRERFVEVDPTGPIPEQRLYRTGDLCRRRPDGELDFLGRMDQQVKIRGFRVELEEIESTLDAMADVDGAAVTVIEDDGGPKRLVAYVVRRDAAVSREAVRAHVAEHLPGYMVPQLVEFLDELPRLPSGKLDRKGLPAPEAVGRRDGTDRGSTRPSAGRSSTERRVAVLSVIRREIASLLGAPDPERVETDKSLYELGLDSLTTVELSSRLGTFVDRKVAVSALLERSTPDAIADYLLEISDHADDTATETPRRDGGAPDTLASFQVQIRSCYPPFLAGSSRAWSATDRGLFVQQFKRLVSHTGRDPFRKLVRTGSGHRGVVADLSTGDEREAIIWTTNLYLGLNRDPGVLEAAGAALDDLGASMGTSAVAAGISDLHRDFEREFAELIGMPAACLYPTGYTANVGVISGVVGEGDVVVMDQLCHASIIDGARMSGAKIRTFQHNSAADLEAVLATEVSPYKTVLVVFESVYSMGEGAAPVEELVRSAKRYGALVLVDEAHSFGFYGPRGAGLCAERGITDQVDFIMGTLSKALGSVGGVIAANDEHVALLKSASRAFIFQASNSPADIGAALAALRRLSTDDSLRQRLWETATYMRQRFIEAGYDLGTGDGPVVTPHFPDKDKLFAIVNGMFERGVMTSAVTYPVVEVGRSRLRFICSASHTREDVDKTLDALIEAERDAEAQFAAREQPADDVSNDSSTPGAGRVEVDAWAGDFADHLRARLAATGNATPDVVVAVELPDGGEPITVVVEGGRVTVGATAPKAVAGCSLQLANGQAVDALCTSDVLELLDAVLRDDCVLNGQIEAFVWFVGRLTEHRSSIA
ncbi:MAG: aminotransferase class I/II-fold pyridoxal phosphate-dependent enzyme, partial [Acidobacteriota bacterium]